jgi:steroid 5-alpha reductase family enzyme
MPLLLSAVAVVLLLLATWALSVRWRDASIVDPVWGPAFVLVAVVSAVAGDGSVRVLLVALVGTWGLRLGLHLAARKRREPEEDRRYAVMRERKGDGFARWSLWAVFGTQGLLVLVVFKRDPSSKGQVMDRGLWRFTRHPNYFGDACVWWGLWLVAVAAGGPWWTAIGPVVMTVLLVRVSGARLLEADIGDRRPGYAEYVRRTSGFVPLPPRG